MNIEDDPPVTEDDLLDAVKGVRNNSTPGIDRISKKGLELAIRTASSMLA